jgi:ATP-dependent exoDNAse (exonuclease V) beta subunit
MPKLDRISFSTLTDYYFCPYFFKLKNIDKVEEFKGNIFTSFGQACHYICENLLFNKIKLEEASDLFDGKFLEELKKIPQEEIDKKFVVELREQGKNLFPLLLSSLENYFGKFEPIHSEFLLHESIGEFETQLKFKGFIDMILKTEDGKFHIIDFKTSTWGWDAQKKSDKKILYQLIYYKNYFAKKMNIPLEQINCHFVLLKRTTKKENVETFEITSGKKRIENAIDYLKVACLNIEKENYPKDKTSCEKCIFKNTEHCKKMVF